MIIWYHLLGNTPNIHMPPLPYTHTHTCGSMERWMGGVRAGCMPPLLKDSERGGREGSEMRLDTLCCSAGELCLFSLDRSSTWDRSHTTVTHSQARSTTNHHAWRAVGIMHPDKPPDNHNNRLWDSCVLCHITSSGLVFMIVTHNKNCCTEKFGECLAVTCLSLDNYTGGAKPVFHRNSQRNLAVCRCHAMFWQMLQHLLFICLHVPRAVKQKECLMALVKVQELSNPFLRIGMKYVLSKKQNLKW